MAEQSVTFQQLVDWVEEKLAPEAAAQVEASVATDSALQATVAWLRDFQEFSKQLTVEAVPSAMRRSLMARFAERNHTAAQPQRLSAATDEHASRPGFMRRFLATLAVANQSGLAPAGARSAASTEERQYLYHTPIAEIALNIQPDGHSTQMTLLGQIFPLGDVEPIGLTVQLLQNAAEVGLTMTDDYGEFSFFITRGYYDLVVATDTTEVMIEQVEL